jgi:hypothetical protein
MHPARHDARQHEYPNQDPLTSARPRPAPPPQVSNQAAAPQGDKDLFAYPKTGQSAEQQNRDRQECRNWAASQTGSGTDGEGNLRAQAACLEGRGYSVK